jgi:MinD superfamily P-loop ATPase
MKQVVVLSGKGGTGKTTVAGALIDLISDKAFADCDVDAPNLHLIHMPGSDVRCEPFYGYQVASIDPETCTGCGQCEALCRFDAIREGSVDPYLCEGCGVCEAFCPSKDSEGRPAICLVDHVSGKTILSHVDGELFSSARLRMGSGASGKLVTQVRANLMEYIENEEWVIIDGSPGIGCPVLASMTGADRVLIVAEPSISGLHDMRRIALTACGFDIPCTVCINKYRGDDGITPRIRAFCRDQGIPYAGEIPYDLLAVQAANQGRSVMEMRGSPAADAIRNIWRQVRADCLAE